MESQDDVLISYEHVKSSHYKRFIGMVIIGILNNVPYWVAFSSAQSICTHFGKEGYIGAVSWGCVVLSIVATIGNTFLSSKGVSYNFRAILNGIFMFGGLLGTAFSPNIYVAIAAISFVGVSSDFGEGVMLGYFAALNDNSLLSAWGVGTGCSGLVGAGYSLLCQYYKIPYFYSFVCMAPCGIIYPLVFYFMLSVPKGVEMSSSKSIPSMNSIASYDPIDTSAPFCSCFYWKRSMRFIINNLLNFMFQYVALQGLCDCSMTHQEKVEQPYIFGIFAITYQAGQFITRAFSKWLMTSKLELITVMTGISFTVILLNDIFAFFPPMYLTIPLFFDGLFGSLSYMSIYNVIMKEPNTSTKDREIITNYVTVSIGGSIQAASAFIIVMQNTFLRKQCIR